MRVLVTGSEGYIGCLLCPYLVERGHDVVGVDAGFYRAGWLYDGSAAARVETTAKDIRRLDRGGSRRRRRGRAHGRAVERPARPARARRHVRDQPSRLGRTSPRRRRRPASAASSTRRRAASTAQPTRSSSTRSRLSPRRPRTPSASSWSSGTSARWPTTASRRRSCATRPRTAPRRGCASTSSSTTSAVSPGRRSEIRMESDGTPWRPLVHVLDICEAIACALEAPRDRVHNADPERRRHAEANYQIREIAEIVGQRLPGLHGHRRRARRRHPQLPRLVRQDPRGCCPASAANGTPSGARGSCSTCSPASTSAQEDFRVEAVHEAQADRAPRRDGRRSTRPSCGSRSGSRRSRRLRDDDRRLAGGRPPRRRRHSDVRRADLPRRGDRERPRPDAHRMAVDDLRERPRVAGGRRGRRAVRIRPAGSLRPDRQQPRCRQELEQTHPDRPGPVCRHPERRRRVGAGVPGAACRVPRGAPGLRVRVLPDRQHRRDRCGHLSRRRRPARGRSAPRAVPPRDLRSTNSSPPRTTVVRRAAYEAVGAEFEPNILFFDYEMLLSPRRALRCRIPQRGRRAVARTTPLRSRSAKGANMGDHRLVFLDAVESYLPPDVPRLMRRRARYIAYLRSGLDAYANGERRRSAGAFLNALRVHPLGPLDPRVAQRVLRRIRAGSP